MKVLITIKLNGITGPALAHASYFQVAYAIGNECEPLF